MVIYFSGTGNSRYTGQLIASDIGDEVLSVNELLHNGGCGSFKSQRPYVFVCPTYAWRIPRIMEHFILDSSFEGSEQAYFVLTCGDHAGNAARYAKKLCAEKALTFMGLRAVIMPENYTALFKVPDKNEAVNIITSAIPVIREAAANIKAGKELAPDRVRLFGRIDSAVINPLFYPLIVSAKGFHTTSACNGCGRCVHLCPLSNIKLEEGVPHWGEYCTHCMACINGCPCGAIEYKRASQGKPRYYLEDTSPT